MEQNVHVYDVIPDFLQTVIRLCWAFYAWVTHSPLHLGHFLPGFAEMFLNQQSHILTKSGMGFDFEWTMQQPNNFSSIPKLFWQIKTKTKKKPTYNIYKNTDFIPPQFFPWHIII